MIKINSFDSYPYPAGTNRSKCTGRSSDSSRLSRLPSFRQWQRLQQTKTLHERVGIHSNRNCSGFTPDSLFTRRPATWLLSSLCTANVSDIFEPTNNIAKYFSTSNAYIYDIKKSVFCPLSTKKTLLQQETEGGIIRYARGYTNGCMK